MKKNIPFDTENPQSIKEFLLKQQKPWVYNPEEIQDEESAFFFFEGKHKGKDVIFDTLIMTLSLHYAATIDDEANAVMQEIYPAFEPEDENMSEEMIEKKAEIIAELEAEGEIKVREFVEIDDDFEESDKIVLLIVALNVEEINDEVVNKFVNDFSKQELKLDENLYAFSLEDED